jgi:hypothetical protein
VVHVVLRGRGAVWLDTRRPALAQFPSHDSSHVSGPARCTPRFRGHGTATCIAVEGFALMPIQPASCTYLRSVEAGRPMEISRCLGLELAARPSTHRENSKTVADKVSLGVILSAAPFPRRRSLSLPLCIRSPRGIARSFGLSRKSACLASQRFNGLAVGPVSMSDGIRWLRAWQCRACASGVTFAGVPSESPPP